MCPEQTVRNVPSYNTPSAMSPVSGRLETADMLVGMNEIDSGIQIVVADADGGAR